MGQKGTCNFCDRKDIAVIDARLLAGESLATVAKAFEVSRSSLYLHWRKCRRSGKAKRKPVAPPKPIEPVEFVTAPPPPLDPEILAPLPLPVLPADDPRASSLAELQRVHKIAQDAYQRAHLNEDNRAIALLVPQLRQNVVKAIEIAMKGRREEKDPAERLMENPEFAAASRVLFGVLDRHPEAKADVIEALEAWIGGEE